MFRHCTAYSMHLCSIEFSLSYVCVCMDFTLSLGDNIVFCSPLCGVVCVIGAPHIDNGPCCRVVAITFILFTAHLFWGGLSTECGALYT